MVCSRHMDVFGEGRVKRLLVTVSQATWDNHVCFADEMALG